MFLVFWQILLSYFITTQNIKNISQIPDISQERFEEIIANSDQKDDPSSTFIKNYQQRFGPISTTVKNSKNLVGRPVKGETLLTSITKKIVSALEYHHSQPAYFYGLKEGPLELLKMPAGIIKGGKDARKALVRLNTIANQINMDKILNVLAPIAMACKVLLIKEEEDVNTKMRCQSIYSRVSDSPVTVQYAEPSKGWDYDKSNIIVVPRPSRRFKPDHEIAKIRAGAGVEYILDDRPLEYPLIDDLVPFNNEVDKKITVLPN